MHEFDTYINSIIGGLRAGKKKKSELYEEFRDHLQMLMNEYIACGMSEEDAAREAIKTFGNSKDLKRKISAGITGYRTIPNVLFGILLIILIIVNNLPVHGLVISSHPYGKGFVIEIFMYLFIGFIELFIPVGYFLPVIFKRLSKIQNVLLIYVFLSPIIVILLSIKAGLIQRGLITPSLAGGLVGSALGYGALILFNKISIRIGRFSHP